MYTKNNTVYAEAYKYLQHKTKPIIGFAIPGTMDDYEEKDIDMSKFEVGPSYITLNGNLRIGIPEFTHKAIKTKIITSRYSNDDQLAIMLNGDEESMSVMQKWREFADDVSERALKDTEEIEDAVIVEE